MTHYLFATCRIGVEAALKTEAAKYGLRPAFMRPGFVSFKSDKALTPATSFPAIFAHTFAASFERTTPDALPAKAAALARMVNAQRVHIYSRALVNDDETPSELAELAEMLDPKLALPRGAAHTDEVVLDIVLVDPHVVMLGAHVHSAEHSPYAGGIPPLVMPEASPSRAWLKFEEALLWHPRTPRPGEIAIEIGSSPGGTAYALIQRGLQVYAVDPAVMDARLTTFKLPSGEKSLVHVQKPAAYLGRTDVDTASHWLLIDINDNPDATLKIAEKTAVFLQKRPALILTLKMATWSLADKLDGYRARIQAMGYTSIRLRQLAFGRREVVILAA